LEDSRRLKKGVGYILIAWLFFTIVATISRFATHTMSIPQVLLFQNLIGGITVLPWVYRHGISSLKTEQFGIILARTIGGLLAFAFLFLAVQKTSLVNAVLLNNTSPIFIPFVVWIWLKIPMNNKLWPGIILGFIGVICVLKPGKDIITLGALYGLGAGVMSSVAMISLRLLSYSNRNHTVLFHFFFLSVLFCIPQTIIFWKTPGLIQWLQLISMGLIGALGQWAFVRAFHHAKASQLGPFCFSAVVYSAIIEGILYGKVPSLLTWSGIILICAGGIWAIRFSQQPPKPVN